MNTNHRLMSCCCGAAVGLHLLLLTMVTLQPSSVLGTEPLQVGSNKQLFIGPFDEHGRDTHLVESILKDAAKTVNNLLSTVDVG